MQPIKKMETLYIDGVQVHYECTQNLHEKNVPVLLLIHGFIASTFTFRYLFPLLAKKYRVISVDLPGFGQSEKSRTFIYSFQNYAKLLMNMLQMLQIDNVIVVGHSMGGQVGLYMAKLRPDRVTKIVLLSSSAYLRRVKKRYIAATYLPFSHKIMQFIFERRNYKRALSHVVYDQNKVDETLVKQYTKAFKDEDFYHALIRLMRHREGDLISEELREIKQPALILWGMEDEIIPVQIGKQLVKDLPNAKLILFHRTGHLLPEERPKEVADKIVEFINN